MPILVGIVITMSLQSCKKGIELSNEWIDEAIIWKWEHYHTVCDAFLYEDNLILLINGDNEPFRVVALSQVSGELVWQSEALDFPGQLSFDLDYMFNVAVSGNKLVVSGGLTTHAVELDEGKVLWSAQLTSGHGGTMCIIDDFVYIATVSLQKSQLWRYPIQTGQPEFLFELTLQEHGNGTDRPVICTPVKWVNAQGDELLIMANSGFDPSDADSSTMDIFAWNLKSKNFAWFKKGFAEQISGRVVIEDNRVYFRSTKQTRCLDAETGNQLWSFFHSNNLHAYNKPMIWLVEDKLVVRGREEVLLALDKMTGKQIWINYENEGKQYAAVRICQGIVWSNWSNLRAFDAHTGEKLLDWNHGIMPFWDNSVVCDPSSGYIFTGDRENVFCLDPEKLMD